MKSLRFEVNAAEATNVNPRPEKHGEDDEVIAAQHAESAE